MSDVIRIRRQQSTRGDGPPTEVFAVPAMGIQTPQGRRLIPNPAGREAAVYATLAEAEEAVQRAGFVASFEGQTLGGGHPMTMTRGRGTTPLAQGLSLAGDALLERLQDREMAVVSQAALALGALGVQAAVPGLIALVGHEDATLRKAVADALGRLGALEAIAEALAHFRQQPPSAALAHTARMTLVQALGELIRHHRRQAPRALPLLADGVRDPHWLVRAQAAGVLAELAPVLRAAEETS